MLKHTQHSEQYLRFTVHYSYLNTLFAMIVYGQCFFTYTNSTVFTFQFRKLIYLRQMIVLCAMSLEDHKAFIQKISIRSVLGLVAMNKIDKNQNKIKQNLIFLKLKYYCSYPLQYGDLISEKAVS